MPTPANKIDSNAVGTYIALESSAIGTLPASPVWYGLEPNSFDDFGGTNTLLARSFINNSRQRTKGNIVDLEAGGGLQIDLTMTNHQDILRGLMFADFRRKGESPITAVAAGEITVGDGSLFPVGSLVRAKYLADDANKAMHKVTAVAANVLTAASFVAEAGIDALAYLERVGIEGAVGDLKIDISGTLPALISTVFDFTTLALTAGDFVFIGDDDAANKFAVGANNGFKRVREVTAHAITFDKSEETMLLDDGDGKALRVFFGRFLKNERGALVKRFSYQIERQLGAADVDAPAAIQAEYLVGSLFNEGTVNVATADKITVDLTVMSTNNEYVPGTTGIKAGTRVEAPGEDPINTSTDVPIYHLAVIEPGNEAPTALFAYVTDFAFTINNNLTVNKAIGVLGGFDVTAGTFEVSAEMEAYFNDVAAADAVKRNRDVTLHGAFVGQNEGIVFDMPLIALGGGNINVEVNEPIKIPLEADAATARKIFAGLDHTLAFVFFSYLPDMAK